jgi:hypothetical protein
MTILLTEKQKKKKKKTHRTRERCFFRISKNVPKTNTYQNTHPPLTRSDSPSDVHSAMPPPGLVCTSFASCESDSEPPFIIRGPMFIVGTETWSFGWVWLYKLADTQQITMAFNATCEMRRIVS